MCDCLCIKQCFPVLRLIHLARSHFLPHAGTDQGILKESSAYLFSCQNTTGSYVLRSLWHPGDLYFRHGHRGCVVLGAGALGMLWGHSRDWVSGSQKFGISPSLGISEYFIFSIYLGMKSLVRAGACEAFRARISVWESCSSILYSLNLLTFLAGKGEKMISAKLPAFLE